MYIYVLNMFIYEKNNTDSIIYDKIGLENKIFDDRDINSVKDYALRYINNNFIKNNGIENTGGYFTISTIKTDKAINSLFDEILNNFTCYTQCFSYDGIELSGTFKSCSSFDSDHGFVSSIFNPNYKSKFKIGDIVYFDDICDSGEYVITDVPKPVTSTDIDDAKVFYAIRGFVDEFGSWICYDSTDGVSDHQLKLIVDSEVKNPKIFILRDFILGKRDDLGSIDDEHLKWAITYESKC